MARSMQTLFVTLVACVSASAAADDGGWVHARGTAYGGPDDWWSIMEGSCEYGYLDQDKATGWNVAALSDAAPDYSGSCGRCYEVKCDNGHVSDNYGQSFDRSSMCFDTSASVVVQITDTCPCNYPANAYSNKRWCCGDKYHLDLSQYAFEQLADSKWGVIPLLIRQVPCSTQPAKKAEGHPVSGPNTRIGRPNGWVDKRGW